MTVCADVLPLLDVVPAARCRPAYDNFAWFLNAATMPCFAAQNLCVEAELKGWAFANSERRSILPRDRPTFWTCPRASFADDRRRGVSRRVARLTDRLPLEGVVHYENYTDYLRLPKSTSCGEREGRNSPNASSRRTTCPTGAVLHAAPLRPQGTTLRFRTPISRSLMEKGSLTTDCWGGGPVVYSFAPCWR